jgi:acyl carrier protein
MNQRTEDQIIEIVKKVTHNSRVDINSTDKSVEGWDSLAYLLIAEKIEDLFDVEINNENIDRFSSIRNVLEMINENKGGLNV